MKKTLYFFLSFFFFHATVFSQNVGIGTTTPVTKLSIVGAGSNPAIPGSTSTALFRIGVSANEGIDFGKSDSSPFAAWIQAGFGGTTPDPISLQPLGGNVGIGTLSPSAKLDVNGDIKLEGLHLFEFGAGVAGKEVNAGKIGYNAFGQNALTFVGAGTSATNRAIYFFAEGGTTASGPLGFNGPLRINGNPGTAGQVLTSNGTSTAEWRNTSYANNTRFAVTFNATTEGGGSINVLSTQFNLNPADVGIGATLLTINKTGLYRLQFSIESRILTAAPLTYVPELTTSFSVLNGAVTLNTFIIGYNDHYLESKAFAGGNGVYFYTRHFTAMCS